MNEANTLLIRMLAENELRGAVLVMSAKKQTSLTRSDNLDLCSLHCRNWYIHATCH